MEYNRIPQLSCIDINVSKHNSQAKCIEKLIKITVAESE